MVRRFVKLMYEGSRDGRFDAEGIAAALPTNPRYDLRRWEVERIGCVLRMQDVLWPKHGDDPPRFAIAFPDAAQAEAAEAFVVRGREREGFVRDDGAPDHSAPLAGIPQGRDFADVLALDGGVAEIWLETQWHSRVHERLLEVLQAPGIASVRALRVEERGWPDDAPDVAIQMLLELIGTTPVCRGLRGLHLESHHDLGDITATLANLPDLERLTLWAWYWRLGAVDLLRLERLELRLHPQGWSSYAELRTWSLPKLCCLHVGIAEQDPHNMHAVGREFLEPFVAAPWFDALEEFGLHGLRLTHGLLSTLCRGLPRAAKVLDLGNNLVEEGAEQALVEAVSRVGRLEVLRLPDVSAMRRELPALQRLLPATRVEMGDPPPGGAT